MLLPVAVVYYSIKKYGLMKPQNVHFDSEIIINDQVRTKMFIYLSNALLADAMINYISQYLFYEDAKLEPVLLFTFILILIGVAFQAIQLSKLSSKAKDILNAITISLIIPVMTLKFMLISQV